MGLTVTLPSRRQVYREWNIVLRENENPIPLRLQLMNLIFYITLCPFVWMRNPEYRAVVVVGFLILAFVTLSWLRHCWRVARRRVTEYILDAESPL